MTTRTPDEGRLEAIEANGTNRLTSGLRNAGMRRHNEKLIGISTIFHRHIPKIKLICNCKDFSLSKDISQ